MNRLACFSVAVSLLLVMPAGVFAGAAEDVAQVIAQRIKAFNEGDLEAFMATVADDSVQTPDGSPFRLEGKEAIRASLAAAFQNFPTRRFVPRQRVIRVYGDMTAVSNTYYTATVVDKTGKATTIHGRLSVTLVKIGGKWLAVDQHVSVLPASP